MIKGWAYDNLQFRTLAVGTIFDIYQFPGNKKKLKPEINAKMKIVINKWNFQDLSD